ncbi:hypothetical protein [Helicobacter pylori]|uniref:hypothetical protein n=1 Tax=Helicobacter pylori TaxID=210 RepID=UPI0013CE307E|nr:hypothetical protein [Helicobacter pylori]
MNLKEIMESFSQSVIMREAKIQTDKRLDFLALIDKHKQHPNRQRNNATLIRYVFS